MMRRGILGSFLCLLVAVSGLARGNEDDARALSGISDQEYLARRRALCSLLDSTSGALLRGADVKVRNNDVNFPYRQESNYLYLTGEKTPSGVLVVLPSGVTIRQLRGQIIHVGGAARQDTVIGGEVYLSGDRLPELLDSVAARVRTLYVSAPDLRFVKDWLNDRPMFLERNARAEFEKKHPGVKTKSATDLLAGLREVKSTAEVGLIQHAIGLTADGVREALQKCKPGTYEYELQAVIE